jgi:glycine cleavage system protein P-like pyridoxal-binding family
MCPARAAGSRDHRLRRGEPAAQRRGQGEYAGLLAIRAYHDAKGETHRDVCLIPRGARDQPRVGGDGAGMKVVPIKSTDDGDIDFDDLRAKAEKHADNLAAIMVTYPSTRRVRGAHPRRLRRSCTSTAGRSTWTART